MINTFFCIPVRQSALGTITILCVSPAYMLRVRVNAVVDIYAWVFVFPVLATVYDFPFFFSRLY